MFLFLGMWQDFHTDLAINITILPAGGKPVVIILKQW
jgi:hypothetical protein